MSSFFSLPAEGNPRVPWLRLAVVVAIGLLQYGILMALLSGVLVQIDRPVLYHGLRLILLILLAFLCLTLDSPRIKWSPILEYQAVPAFGLIPLLQIATFIFAIVFAVIADRVSSMPLISNLLIGISYFGVALAMAMLLLIIAPLRAWVLLIRTQLPILVAATVLGFVVFCAALYSLELWSYLVSATFYTSSQLLGLVSDNVVSNPETLVLGVGEFRVRVLAWCSGIEGMTLATAFTSIFLYVYRKQLKFPMALVFLPASILAMWLMNNLRIVTLILIGAHYSSDLAIGGFHSNAGWVAFIATEVVMLALAHRYAFIKHAGHSEHSFQVNDAVAMLFPGVMFFTAILVTLAFTDGFPWLYPLRVIFTLLVVAMFWKYYRTTLTSAPSLMSVAAGMVVFLLWLLLIAADPEMDQSYQLTLSTAGTLQTGVWLLFRLLGAVLVAPLVEELLFRGYLLATLSRETPSFEKTPGFSFPAIIVSSLVFGVMHEYWIAATIAGGVYAAVRIWKRSLGDAIYAHAITNGLLFVYVLKTGQWSLL